jgi:hypothetical protein
VSNKVVKINKSGVTGTITHLDAVMKELANFLQNSEFAFVNYIDLAFINDLIVKAPNINATISESLYTPRNITIFGVRLERYSFIPQGWVFAADTKPNCLSDLLSMDCKKIPYEDDDPWILETEDLVRVFIIMNM